MHEIPFDSVFYFMLYFELQIVNIRNKIVFGPFIYISDTQYGLYALETLQLSNVS